MPPCSYISVSVLLKRWLCAARALCWPLHRNASALRAPARASSELIHEINAEWERGSAIARACARDSRVTAICPLLESNCPAQIEEAN